MTNKRPITPNSGQESVWEYPRPPRLEPVNKVLRVDFAGETIALSERGYRVLETSHPPVYYIPAWDIRREFLTEAPGHSFCEFKGFAQYWSLEAGGRHEARAAWSYPEPTPSYAAIQDHLAFYASRVDACWVGDEQVQPQEGDFYGGWITSSIIGPFKGGPGTAGW